MLNEDFYKVINREFDSIIEKYKEEEVFQTRLKKEEQKKAYSFMIWFLEFYGKISRVREEIVDGPGDFSCDIIFPKVDYQNETVYYVVQSKWNTEAKCNKMISSDEIKKTLNDFDTILRGSKYETNNERFNKRIKDLQEHLDKNGKVEFLFITLSQQNPDAEENLISFEKANPNMFVRVFDIHHIKKDFIDVHYKKLERLGLLRRRLNPINDKITIKLERLGTNNNQIQIKKPFDAYIFLIRPKLVYELFLKYGYSLFIENVRNPIKDSDINQRMQETLIKEPAYFWYYNNGITAISSLIPELSKRAKEFEITGLQVINGAQTVHAVYKAYHEASTTERQKVDEEVLLTLRLYKSAGEDFDRKVTKYTNAQNPMSDRDFWANDPVQIRLQEESFTTPFWYQKRRDEFVDVPEGITVLDNKFMAGIYISFIYQLPFLAKQAFKDEATKKYDALFLSKKEDDKFGLYEILFNQETKYKDILVSEHIYFYIEKILPKSGYYNNLQLSILGLFKTVFENYLYLKFPHTNEIDTIDYIYKCFQKQDYSELSEVIRFMQNYIHENYKLEEIQDDAWFLNKEFMRLKVLLPEKLHLEELN